ncbi:MAG: hypothetical protein ACO3N7_10030 [Kiritimatiellia bacterium]
MSKKQLQQLRSAPGLLAGIFLVCFPGGLVFSGSSELLPALICGILSLGIAHSLLKLGPLPTLLRPAILFPIASSSALTLLALPSPYTVLWLMIPFALLLLSVKKLFRDFPPFLLIVLFTLTLSAGSLPLLTLLHQQPHQGLPRLPQHLLIWGSALIVLPLGFASRQMLRPLARRIALTEVFLLGCSLPLFALLWTGATAFKIPGEPALTFHELRPRPRIFLLPNVGIPDFTPSELRNHPLQTEILFTLDEMTWRLHEAYLRSLFEPEASISPEEMVRAMKLYGFLLEDRHGAFLPGDSFTRPAPPEMDSKYLTDFQQAMNRIVIRPAELADLLGRSPALAEEVLESMRELQWTQTVPGSFPRYRLTPQARRPFKNGLYPRQLLLLHQADPETLTELDPGSYEPRRQMGLTQSRQELLDLVKAGAAETRQVWRLNQHSGFLLSPELWRRSAALLIALLLGLLLGRCLPAELSRVQGSLLSIAALLLCFPFSLPLAVLSCLRIAAGLWLLRSLLALPPSPFNRLALFSACSYFSAVILPSLPAETALIHQCLWAIMSTLPAALLLFFAVRPLK